MGLRSVKRGYHDGESGWAAVRNGEKELNPRHFGRRIETTCELVGWGGKERMKGD